MIEKFTIPIWEYGLMSHKNEKGLNIFHKTSIVINKNVAKNILMIAVALIEVMFNIVKNFFISILPLPLPKQHLTTIKQAFAMLK